MRGTSALPAVPTGLVAASAAATGLPAEERFRCVEEVVLRHEGVDRDDDLGVRLAFDGDTLGAAVAVHGDRILVGAPHERPDMGDPAPGAAHVFVRTAAGWEHEARLVPSGAAEGPWQEQALVSSPDAAPLERFGTTVALSGDRLAAGAPLAGAGVASVGRASVFACERNRPPSCTAGEDLMASCDGVALEAVAEDPDGDRLAFSWSSDCPEAIFLPGPDVPDPVVVFGSSCRVDCTLRLEVVDEGGLRCADEIRIAVDDETAPTLEPPPPLSLECEGPDGFEVADPRLAAWLGAAVASDDCSEAVVGHDAPDLFEVRCPGEPPQAVRFTATDACGNRAEASSSVAAVDTTAPELTVPEPLTLECDGAGGLPAADPRIRAWLEAATATDGCSEPVVSHDAPDFFASGCEPGRTTEVAFRAVDACGHETVASSRVIVVDRTAPEVVRSEARLGCLWPPNGAWVRFVQADVAVEASDLCDPAPPSWGFVDCSSDQPVDGLGDGHRAPDCRLEDGGSAFSVRAERAGPQAAGRTYSVRVVAWDVCGNVSEPELVGRVRAPHDRRRPEPDCRVPAPPRGDVRGE